MNDSRKSFKFLLYISKCYAIPVFKPLVSYLSKTQHSFKFYISERVYNHFPRSWDKSNVIKSLSEAKNYQPDFVLVSGNFVDFRIPGIKVQLFHGLGVEKDVHFKIRHFFDVYLTSGPYVTERFIKLQQKYKYFLVKETGWSKIDYIINFQKQETDALQIPSGKKIILYAPTFSTDHQSATSLMHYIPGIIRDDELWFIKFHELMKEEVIENYKTKTRDRAIILQDIDITPYLHAADVLISDTSSVIYEFMVLDKPLITFRTKGAKDKGIDISSENQLREAIDRCLAHPDENRQNRYKHINFVNPYTDGKVSERILDALIQIKTDNLLKGKRKPLNLVRKLQIIYHGLFKKGYLR